MKSDATPLVVLTKDKTMETLISSLPPLAPVSEQDVYEALLRSIISQQLSTKVAKVISNRFLSFFPENDPKPDLLIATHDEHLRGLGLSWQKIKYVKDVAKFKLEGALEHKAIAALNDEEVISQLTKIKGVGKWTAEMILIFSLNRQNVFPLDDLGIQNAMVRLYNFTETGKPLKARMLEQAELWQPYRSIASRYLWKWLDNS